MPCGGEIKGSRAKPSQSRIDLREPAFKWSWSEPEFPCKHGLALLLVHSREAKAFAGGESPAWVADWRRRRNPPRPDHHRRAPLEAGVKEMDGALVLDPRLPLLRMAEMLVELGRAGLGISRRGFYRAKRPKDLEQGVRDFYGSQ